MTRAAVVTIPAPDATLEAAYRECARITRERARNFYYGLRLTPEPKRSAIYSVYAWMRHADDLADAESEVDSKSDALRRFAEPTELALGGGGGDSDRAGGVLNAFAETVRRYGIDRADVSGMIEGLETDLRFESRRAGDGLMFADRAAFEGYCDGVASTVGRVCVRIWGLMAGADHDAAARLASVRGLAFQTTNILRDFREDFDAPTPRVYLPADLFARHALTPAMVRAWSYDERCGALVLEACDWARGWYDRSEPLNEMILPECRPALRAMTRIYRSLLDIIAQDPARVAGARRVRVRSWRKAAIALGAVREARLRS